MNFYPLCAGGLRKKKAAPAPPPPRPLSSAISTQALERIVDSEESFTSDIEASPRANSDVAVAPKRKVITPPVAPKVETETERRESVHSEPEEAHPSISIPEVAAIPIVETPSDRKPKRGKLVRSRSSIEDNAPSFSFVSRESLESVLELRGEVTTKPRRRLLARSSANVDFNDSFRCGKTELTKSQSFNSSNCDQNQFYLLRRVPKLPEIDSLREIDIENMPSCGILESRFSPKRSHTGNYICDEKCQVRLLKQSMSFQSTRKLKETKISNSFELTSSRSFNCKPRQNDDDFPAKLGDFNLAKSHRDPIISSREIQSPDFLPAPFPLSNLQIFAISTKPENVQANVSSLVIPAAETVQSLPSLPIDVKYGGDTRRLERKVSIFKPPPPGLVSRQESNENWNNFLVRLNSILESRAGEFV